MSHQPSRRVNSIRTGLRPSVGLAASGFILASTFGALARTQGWGNVAPIVASLSIFSGSAQFTLLSAIGGGGAVWAAVASAGLVNLRFLPMALAVGPALRGGRIRKAVEAQSVVDSSWVLAHRGNGRFDRGVLLGSSLAQWPAWVAGTVLGVFAAPPEHLLNAAGVDVVFPAFFALLLLDELKHDRVGRRAAALAALVTAALLLVLPAGPALLGGASAALIRRAGREIAPC